MTIDPSASAPRLFAHRGTALLAPENTSAAFDLALQYKSDVLEIDVRLSRDGHVIVTHDEDVVRTTNGTGLVRNMTLLELKQLNAASKFIGLNGEPYDGSKVSLLTLDELFQHYPTIGVNIDIKDNNPQATKAVAKSVERYADNRWINVGSFNAKVMKEFRALLPHISTAATRQEVAKLVFNGAAETIPYQILQIPVTYWGIPLARKKLIERAHNAGKKIVHWTINDPALMYTLLERRNDGIVTDRPDLALAEFQRLGHKR